MDGNARLHRRIHAVTAASGVSPLAERFVALLTEVDGDLADRWAATPIGG